MLASWVIFVRERFPIFRHLTLIFFFWAANIAGSLEILSFFVILSAFFRLRVFDEIKDYETDLIVHPERPLARGLICLSQAKQVGFLLILFELTLSTFLGLPAFIAACCVVLYSLLMYKEFFLSSWLRTKLATYALTHTLIAAWFSLFLFSAATNLFFWEAPMGLCFANWMIFNVFEFGRKTFGKVEEKTSVESYSRNFGSWGAAFCVLGMAAAAEIAAWDLLIGPVALFVPLWIAGLCYGASNSVKWARRFRHVCSLYILFFYISITMGFLL